MSSLPFITGSTTSPLSILLINPNSTPSMTQSCLSFLGPTLPPHVTVTGFTAPPTAPTAIEGHSDAVLSTALCLHALLPIATQYDGFLVACFSAHPLIAALREEVSGPVIGIMEAALYAARMLGSRFGIIATAQRAKLSLEHSVRDYGLSGFSAGVVSTGLGVLDLDKKPRDEVLDLVGEAARVLVEERDADCIALGCAGMVEMVGRCEEVVGEARVVDGVTVGVQFLVGLCAEGLGTARMGVYRSAAETRRGRGQDYL
ncbi:hydantoin racemase [Lasallia pustulata]|uniref:Hydantoin racemase n=1 Tax=Lasallia pustulata TaxID=136370 RepID=A0A1W5D7F8_9LECA|nr:hydantoin racemase [Lasallia pustulata]